MSLKRAGVWRPGPLCKKSISCWQSSYFFFAEPDPSFFCLDFSMVFFAASERFSFSFASRFEASFSSAT